MMMMMMMMPLGAKYKTYTVAERVSFYIIRRLHGEFLKSYSVYFSHRSARLTECCWIQKRRGGRNSQTDSRLSRRNKHAGKQISSGPKNKKRVWK